MSTPTTIEKGKHRIEQYQAFFDVLAERADAYAKRGAHKLAWKLLGNIEKAKRYNAGVLAMSDEELKSDPYKLENCLISCLGTTYMLVEELAKVHLSLVARSVSNAVKEINRIHDDDTDLGALAAVIRHYFSA